ncbi:MAG: spermidine synthase [Chloroflexi bacterium AL-W]|nr:spermidine synthase [Chloroflexi bacterium AL-N1]NOK70614.1 spermidine synthase [Chloroflexi bacterium AL-N10]NOK77606.1 spermidine synthase [Chloroflexi bacterium AL-N5]NOK84457.1 spermidine synthase [Chloroflexi bacterium AL-W]NOK92346.1 spermidine synthase [Chloroflexi bacterium AL-N15]
MEHHTPATSSAKRRDAAVTNGFLLLTVFLAGIGTLGVEMIASRLLAPYFGTSQPVWAVVIGLTLIYLSIGYRLGGSLADRRPEQRLLFQIIVWAGLCTAFIPILSDPILRFSQQALLLFRVGSFVGALFAVLLLFSVPVILMAMVSPFAIRLQLARAQGGIETAGGIAGSISAISTVGSILGTFVTVLYLIPTIGTMRTTYLFAFFLMIIGLIGLRDWRYFLMPAIAAALAFYTLNVQTNIKSADCDRCTLIHEEESAYNYIQVIRQEVVAGDAIRLMLNEGLATHSIYYTRFEDTGDPIDLLSGGGPWDYFAVAPYFYPERDPTTVNSMLMLGAATGTAPQQFLAIYGADSRVDAVEIDPSIVEVGRTFFALEDASVSSQYPDYHVHTADARYWLETQADTYDVIAMDAYHQPYIPFHLTTVEFFQSVKTHLNEDGVAVVNAGVAPNGDDRLVQTLGITMLEVFPQIFIIDTIGGNNRILVGVNTPVGDGVAHFEANLSQMQQPVLREVMNWAVNIARPLREFQSEDSTLEPFTDDKAPVEQLIDSLIFNEVAR